ncbi:MAG: helix-turn-helix domain containing protein [Candidatus Caenarcaniphilales bacterium]|nr:helix-turn-helix domain containing protein [Candidatus Caenarcaniphilales bacterium]
MKKTEIRSDISIEEIRVRESKEKRKAISDRIRVIRLALEGYEYTAIAEILGKKDYSYTSNWIKRFNEAGFTGLETKKGQGRPRILNDKENKLIEEWLKDPNAHGYNVWTAPRLQEKIKEEFQKEPSEQCVYDTLEYLDFKHRKARPTPSKADPKELEDFKKAA